MTQITSADFITDKEVAVFLSDGKNFVEGVFFCCCEELNESTAQLICSELTNLKRLKLSKFIKLNDNHIQEIVNSFPELEFLNLE